MRTLLSMWIAVEESLPEKGSTVLGFRDADPHWGNTAYGMAWREIDDESKPCLHWNESGSPTHWMRLPAPPRDAEREKIIDGLSGQTTLTDAEREAIWFFAVIDSNDSMLGSHAATLRGLLGRLAMPE